LGEPGSEEHGAYPVRFGHDSTDLGDVVRDVRPPGQLADAFVAAVELNFPWMRSKCTGPSRETHETGWGCGRPSTLWNRPPPEPGVVQETPSAAASTAIDDPMSLVTMPI
jgi:hypothetical protein